ncbi:MAG: hypothetical protein ACYSWP_16985 [Planctomycetota bacterium]
MHIEHAITDNATRKLLADIAEHNNFGPITEEDRHALVLQLAHNDSWLHDAISESGHLISELFVKAYKENDQASMATAIYQVFSEYVGGDLHLAYLDVCDRLKAARSFGKGLTEQEIDAMRRANDMNQEFAK